MASGPGSRLVLNLVLSVLPDLEHSFRRESEILQRAFLQLARVSTMC